MMLRSFRQKMKNVGTITLLGNEGSSACADPESFARGGPTLTTFFFFFLGWGGGGEDPNPTKSWPSLASQRNAI